MSKWASNKNHKMLFENWRKFVNEQEEGEVAPAPEAQSQGLVDINAGPEHVLKVVPKLLQDRNLSKFFPLAALMPTAHLTRLLRSKLVRPELPASFNLLKVKLEQSKVF